MAIKRKGVFAAPGEYTYGDVVEIKTAEELKLAAERQPIIRLTMGHPVDNHPFARDVIGTVSQKWDEEHQRVNGEFWFYDEKVPDDIREKLVNNQPIPISAGIMLDDLEDSVQKGISYTHMAVLEDEDPKCPLDTCGINIRMESEPTRHRRYEQKTELEASEEIEVVPDEKTEIEVPTEPEVETEEPKTDEPAEQKPEAVVEEPEIEEVKLVPERMIPVGETVPNELEVDDSGCYVFYPHKKKEKQKWQQQQ